MAKREKRIVGWREWVSLPGLGVKRIKAKIDTGAKTSALHAFEVERYQIDGKAWVRFTIHPLQHTPARERVCQAPILDRRWVTNPGGRRQKRIIIETPVRIGDDEWPIELSLTERDEMGFRMLIGRTAMHGRLVVDPDTSYRTARRRKAETKGGKSAEKRITTKKAKKTKKTKGRKRPRGETTPGGGDAPGEGGHP